MEFHYYYIIQDIIGVFMAFIGMRMFTLSIKIILSRKKSKNMILLCISYALITFAGINLLLNEFGLKPWIISIILILSSLVITKVIGSSKNN